MNKILLCTDGSAHATVVYQYAAWLAGRIELEIEVLYVSDERAEKAVQTNDFSGSIGIDSYQKLLGELVELEAQKAKIDRRKAKIILQEAESFLEKRDINNVKLTHETGFLVDLFHEFEENKDLIILGKRGENADFATEHLGSNLERILRLTHKPCLVTPREFRNVNRVLLAYDGGESCQKALEYLADSAIFKDLELHIVYVKDREAEKALERIQVAESILKQSGFSPICEVLEGNLETVMEEYIAEKNIDFLLMGAYGHSRIRRLIIGSTTAQMLRSSHIPVLLFR